MKALQVDRANQLRTHRNALVKASLAPDGLPILLDITRGVDPNNLISPIAHALGYKSDDNLGAFSQTAHGLKSMLEQAFLKYEICAVNTLNGTSDCYVGSVSVREITKGTLAERVLFPEVPVGRAAVPDTRMLSVPRSERRSIDAFLQRSPGRLALELDNGLTIMVRANSYLRDFVPESLEYFESAQLLSIDADRSIPKTRGEYIQERLNPKRWVCQVDRSEVVEMIADVADLIETLHNRERIHGDLKPSNVLATRDELIVVDSLELDEGVRAPALTPDWAAPEQILGEPVAKTTDQYPIGLMLLKLLNGALFGEEARFAVPTLEGKIARFTLLRNPGVFLQDDCVPDAGTERCNELLRKCVQFDHRKRFPSMRALANEIRRLNAAHPAKGVLQFELNFGDLVEAMVEGETTVAWTTHLRSTSK